MFSEENCEMVLSATLPKEKNPIETKDLMFLSKTIQEGKNPIEILLSKTFQEKKNPIKKKPEKKNPIKKTQEKKKLKIMSPREKLIQQQFKDLKVKKKKAVPQKTPFEIWENLEYNKIENFLALEEKILSTKDNQKLKEQKKTYIEKYILPDMLYNDFRKQNKDIILKTINTPWEVFEEEFNKKKNKFEHMYFEKIPRHTLSLSIKSCEFLSIINTSFPNKMFLKLIQLFDDKKKIPIRESSKDFEACFFLIIPEWVLMVFMKIHNMKRNMAEKFMQEFVKCDYLF